MQLNISAASNYADEIDKGRVIELKEEKFYP